MQREPARGRLPETVAVRRLDTERDASGVVVGRAEHEPRPAAHIAPLDVDAGVGDGLAEPPERAGAVLRLDHDRVGLALELPACGLKGGPGGGCVLHEEVDEATSLPREAERALDVDPCL